MSEDQKPRQASDPHAEREAAKYEHPIASRELILEFVSKNEAVTSIEEVCVGLQVDNERDQVSLERRMRAMERDGQLIRHRRGGYTSAAKAEVVSGKIIGHSDGFGFLHPDESGASDIFLSPQQMRGTWDGDRASVRVTNVKRDGRREGMLLEVLEHNNKEIIGRYHEESGVCFVRPDNKRLHQDIVIPKELKFKAQPGQIVCTKIVEQPTKRSHPIGEIAEVLGEHMGPGMEIDIAIRSHNLPSQFNEEVLAEVDAFSESSITDQLPQREDLRDLHFVTIDGEDAKDYDDAVYCEETKDGWKLYVAIADVAFYVKPKTSLDDEAQWRGTSVYFPSRVIPMLPEHLSNGLCSLKPKIPRLSLVCEMQISAKGELGAHRFYKAVIQSHARLTYTEVAAAICSGEREARENIGELCSDLDNLYLLYKAFLGARTQRGAIEFNTTETKIDFGPDQKIERVYPYIRNDAHRIIEECMITANVAAARFLSKHKFPALYRVHEGPAETKIEELRALLKLLGLTLGGDDQPTPADYAKLLIDISRRPDDSWLETVLLRSLKQAIYTPENVGHFGLSLDYYAHFTSPIRRYPDLVVHRAISHILQKKDKASFTYTPDELIKLGEHCSMTERRADEATRDAMNWLKCEYAQDKLGQQFVGTITSVTAFGLFIELGDMYIEGLLHISGLRDDYYSFDPVRFTLVGDVSGKRYRLGDKVDVIIARVDLDERKIDLTLANQSELQQRPKRTKKDGAKGSKSSEEDKPRAKKKTGAKKKTRAKKKSSSESDKT